MINHGLFFSKNESKSSIFSKFFSSGLVKTEISTIKSFVSPKDNGKNLGSLKAEFLALSIISS